MTLTNYSKATLVPFYTKTNLMDAIQALFDCKHDHRFEVRLDQLSLVVSSSGLECLNSFFNEPA